MEEGISTVEIDGRSLLLTDFLQQDPVQLLGERYYKKFGANVEVLVKFLDSSIRLHVQCHPTIPFTKKFLNSDYGKTEAYYILSTRPENHKPYIYMAFQNPPEYAEFKKMIEVQDITAIEACFEKISVQPGDIYIVPGRIPHAIGEGVMMVEIMEPSDWAVRIEFEKAGYPVILS